MKHGTYDIWNLEIDSYKEEYLSEMYDDTCIDYLYLHCEEMYPEIFGLRKKSPNLWTATVCIFCLKSSDKENFELACTQLKNHFDWLEHWKSANSEYDDFTITVSIDHDMSLYDAYFYIMNSRDKVIEATQCLEQKKLTAHTQREITKLLPVYQRAMNRVKLELLNYITDNDSNANKIIEIEGRVKELSSIEEKVYRKNICEYEVFDKFDDIAGVRCICEYLDDVYDVLTYLKSNPLLKIVDIDDKIEKSSPPGYRGIHVIVTVNVFFQDKLYENIKVETQLRTAFQNAWSTKTHILTYKQDNANTAEVENVMKELSEVLYEADKVALRMKKLQSK